MRILFAVCLALPMSAAAWDGYDYGTNASVEIEKGNLVRPGKEIEYYDYGSGQYKSGEVESVRRSGRNVEVEITDPDTGQIRTFEMDGK